MSTTAITSPIFQAQVDTFHVTTCWAKVKRVAWTIFSTGIFPIALLEYALPYVLYPGRRCRTATQCAQIRATDFNPETMGRRTIQAVDGTILDTVQIKAPQNSDRHILFLYGNCASYELELPYLETLARETGQNVYCGNHRGIGDSKGCVTSSQDLLIDGDAFIQDLLHQGVPLRNITLHGHSMGGGVACALAAKYPGVRLVADRTFSSIGDAAAHFSGLPFASALTSLGGWSFDNYTNFRNAQGPKTTIHHAQCFLNPCGLYTKLKAQGKAPGRAIAIQTVAFDANDAHCAPLRDQALTTYRNFVR